MFRKRKLEVKVVKDQDTSNSFEDLQNHNALVREVGANANVLIDNVVVGGLMLIGAYFAADTVRHCVIHTVAVKVTPTVVEVAKAAK